MDKLVHEIERRWREMFARLAGGDDVSPGMRLRAEGLMEAAVLVGDASPDDLQAAMAATYLAVYQRPIEQDFGEQWRDDYPFPQIPAMARRAPVYPSTAE
jgi:hypothetical protein